MCSPSVSSSSSAGRDLARAARRRARASRRARTRRARRSPARARRRAGPSPGSARPWSGTSARCRPRRPRAPSASSPALVDDADRARRGDLERLVVRAVLLGGLRHQADVRASCPSSPGRTRRARGSGRRSPRRAGRRSESGITNLVSSLLALGVPHLARRADRGRHRGVDDHVARDVKVGDPAVGVDHRERAARSSTPPAIAASIARAGRRAALDRLQQRAQAVVRGRHPRTSSASPCSANTSREVRPHGMAEDDRVGHLHHRRLQVHGEQDVAAPWRPRSARRGTPAAPRGASRRRR